MEIISLTIESGSCRSKLGRRLGRHAKFEAGYSSATVDGAAPGAAQVSMHAYRHSHSGIGVIDYLLAGTVSAVGADLVTTNVRHFPMFDDLRPPYDYGPPEQRRAGPAR